MHKYGPDEIPQGFGSILAHTSNDVYMVMKINSGVDWKWLFWKYSITWWVYCDAIKEYFEPKEN